MPHQTKPRCWASNPSRHCSSSPASPTTSTEHRASFHATCSGVTARASPSPCRGVESGFNPPRTPRRWPCKGRGIRSRQAEGMAPGAGRFAPSPSADLHIGNLRTAVLAWLFARSTGRRFLIRVDDLDDRTFADIGNRQLDDLAAIGLTSDETPEWQTEHTARYDAAIAQLVDRGRLYECYCSRRDIAQAPRAPHTPQGAYPGTCRDLTDTEREARRRETGRPPALRLRTDAITYTVHDLLHGEYTGIVDDFVVRRGDGVPAYNLAVVVDDAARGVDQVVRGDDLLPSSPRQAYLARLLGYPEPTYAHVALVLNEDGARLAKRDGAVTLPEIGVPRALAQIASSLGYSAATPEQMLTQFKPAALHREPGVYHPTFAEPLVDTQ